MPAVVLGAVGVVVVVLFQNCSPMAASDVSNSKQSSSGAAAAVPAVPFTGGPVSPGGNSGPVSNAPKVFQASVTGVPVSKNFVGDYTIVFDVQPAADTENLPGMRYYALIFVPSGIAGPGDVAKDRWFLFKSSDSTWVEINRQSNGQWLSTGSVEEPFSDTTDSLLAQGRSPHWKLAFNLKAEDLNANFRGMTLYSAYGTSINDFLVRKSYSQGVLVPPL
ncbi:MAG: hypothetical protein JNJ49_00435 [Bdellovibrionaceae bacterium]|nr:hypothetical protein [Pseudobdellovibrionaceae bacterium]